jgi:hypothetical protein
MWPKCTAKLLTMWNAVIVCCQCEYKRCFKKSNKTQNDEMVSTQNPLYRSQQSQKKATTL